MKKFPPNFELTNEIPGVGGGINLEAYEEDDDNKLSFYFYLNEYRADRLDESGKFLRMSDEEESELIAKVDAWLAKHDIGVHPNYIMKYYRNKYLTDYDLIWTDKYEADNYYWAYMDCPEIIMKIWKTYWGPHFIINYNQKLPQVIQ